MHQHHGADQDFVAFVQHLHFQLHLLVDLYLIQKSDLLHHLNQGQVTRVFELTAE